MSDKELNVQVVCRSRMIWEGAAEYVRVPATDGSLGILPGRQPLLAVLSPGKLEVHLDGSERVQIEVDSGFLSLDEDKVTVVVEDGAVVAS